jgi:hypothetical protein
MKKEVWNLIIYTLSTFLIELPYFFIILTFTFITKYIFIDPLLLLLGNTNSIILGSIEIIIATIIYGTIYTLIISPFITFYMIFGTKFNSELCERYVPKE